MASVSQHGGGCSRKYGSPGDILFSTVAGAPPHVHSPQKIGYDFELGKSVPPAKCMPISLSNSLIDPNIELPAISVRDVDAVLSSLNSSVSSNVAPDEMEYKTDLPERGNFGLTYAAKCSEAVGICSVSSPITSDDNCKGRKHFFTAQMQLTSKTPQCAYHTSNSNNSANRRAFSLSIDRITESNKCNNFDSGVSSCLFGHTSDDSCSTDRASQSDERSHSDFSVNGIMPRSIGMNHSTKYDSVQILTIRSAGSARFPPQPIGTQQSKAVSGDCVFGTSSAPAMQRVSVNDRKPSMLDIPLPPPQQLVRDRSPFVSLDLATQTPTKKVNPPPLGISSEAEKYREANLSVRIANQAQFFPSRSIGSLVRSARVIQSAKLTTAEPVSEGRVESAPNCGPLSEQVQRHVHVQPSSGDDRFRYACPHPRCGRRYQAELALLRHLHKYHCEPIELPHRRRPAPGRRVQRRPASEERSNIHLRENDSVKDDNVKVLQSSVSVEDSESGSRTITMITGIDNRQLSQPENSVVRASANTGSVAATKSADKSELRIQPSVLGCHPVTSNLSSSPSAINATASGPRRCIVLQHNSLTGRTNLVRSTSISHNFPQIFDLPETNELSNITSLHPLSPEHNGSSPFRVPRLRSVSGSVSSPVDPIGSPHPFTDTDACASRSWRLAESHQLFDATTPSRAAELTPHIVWPPNDTDMNRLASEEPNSNLDENDGQPDAASTSTEVTCPSCGFDLDESDSRRREWMSGVRALAYSKTDSIVCPMDGCAHMCSGRADLSSHLTTNHFPEVQNQLVRLIFACPLKDCQTVCPDEISFQSHFNRHLFGYLPGDLSGLFSSGPGAAAEAGTITSSVPVSVIEPINSTAIQTVGPANMVSNKAVVPDNNSVPEELVEQAATCTTSTPVRRSFALGERRREVYLDLTSPGTDTGPLRSASTEPHVTYPDVGYADMDAGSNDSQVAATTVTSNNAKETRALSDNSILVLRSSDEALLVSAPESGSAVSSDLIIGPDRPDTTTTPLIDSRQIGDSGSDKMHPGGLVMTDTAFPTSITFGGSHVDLTDHRNLLSALDLIPDDILMELLKEDRPSMWGDSAGPSNLTTYSAPHEWDSPGWPVPDDSEDPISDTLSSHAQHTDRPDSSSAAPMPAATSCDSLHEFVTASDEPLGPSSTNWVPSPVVHETWSLAVANEHSIPDSDTASSRSDRGLSNSFDCPRLVLSDLTAALILPDVERRLRAKHEASQHNRTTCTAPTGVSPCLVSTPMSTNAVMKTMSTVSTSDVNTRYNRQALGSGKRRRNASESSPTAHHTKHNIAVSQLDVPLKSGKHGSSQTETIAASLGSETSSHSLISKENKRSHGSMTQTLDSAVDLINLSPSSPASHPLAAVSPRRALPSPVNTVRWFGKAASFQRLCPSPGLDSLDDAVFLRSTATPARGSHCDLVDLGLHASPKHFGAQPKRRRRKLPNVYTVSSDLAPVMVIPSKTSLPRRHSLVYCNLIPSSRSPH